MDHSVIDLMDLVSPDLLHCSLPSRMAFIFTFLAPIADVSANLKNAVSKPATQKILLALAEKSDIKQKTYGAFMIPIPSIDLFFSWPCTFSRKTNIFRRETGLSTT